MDTKFMDEKLDFHGLKFIQKFMVVRRGKSMGVMAFNIEPDIIPLHTLLEQKITRVVLGKLSICQ
jgi:hypothetical protein